MAPPGDFSRPPARRDRSFPKVTAVRPRLPLRDFRPPIVRHWNVPRICSDRAMSTYCARRPRRKTVRHKAFCGKCFWAMRPPFRTVRRRKQTSVIPEWDLIFPEPRTYRSGLQAIALPAMQKIMINRKRRKAFECATRMYTASNGRVSFSHGRIAPSGRCHKGAFFRLCANTRRWARAQRIVAAHWRTLRQRSRSESVTRKQQEERPSCIRVPVNEIGCVKRLRYCLGQMDGCHSGASFDNRCGVLLDAGGNAVAPSGSSRHGVEN